ncbi:MAG: chiA1 3 [Chitinophagaceae bacterium]|nr:chiA1 3 [Chitinophagaceae bacterium]
MKRKVALKCILVLLCLVSTSSIAQFKVVGYLPTWLSPGTAINSVDLDKMTHINIAFFNPTSNAGTAISGTSTTQVDAVVTACHNKNVKAFISIGGAQSSTTIPNRYKAIVGTAATQTTFVTTLRDYVLAHNLDGVDVDIEGDILNGTYVTKVQYQSFVTELGDTLHNHGKKMSAALANWFASYVSNTAASKFDWINIMSYDAYGPWSGPGDHSPYSLAVSDFQYWNTTKAMPASKLTIGVPFYGYGWGTYDTGDEIRYCDVINTYTVTDDDDRVGSGSNMISFNGLTTIRDKTTYALANASGIMIWQITEDCATSNTRSLLRAIDSLVHPQTVTAVTDAQLAQGQLNVFPNPASDHLQVQLNLSSSSNGSLLLCDLNGNVLQQLANGTLDAQANYTITLEHYPTGLYILKLATDQGTVARKIVKQ